MHIYIYIYIYLLRQVYVVVYDRCNNGVRCVKQFWFGLALVWFGFALADFLYIVLEIQNKFQVESVFSR
jgi:hypothetical protein